MQIHWHRRDLRTADNRGLAVAADVDGADAADGVRTDDAAAGDGDGGPALPVFVFDDDVLAFGSPPRVRFMLDALAALRDRYRDLGSDLAVARGDPRTVLPALAAAADADRVVWNADYSGLARTRDDDVAGALDDAGVAHDSFHDAVHHEPGSITTNAGDPYAVFTYFWKKWRDRPKADPYPEPDPSSLAERGTVADVAEAAAVADGGGAVDVAPGSLPDIDDLGFAEPAATVPEAGAGPARDRLRAFCDGPIFTYEEDREYPAREGTSRLSTDLKWGTVGVREVYAATAAAMTEAEGEAADSVEEFQSQLAWREFYTQVLATHPRVVTENYREYENDVEWEDDPDLLRAWQEGETGYPVVDAGMRQLRAEAWMHNRVRMIVASFLTKDLLVDWRHGYDWFRERLADHDTANDNGGWQWAASTGTDAQPYFRIFNPMTQGERYDPDAEYVREYVPELRGVDADTVHSWHELSVEERREAAPDYPDPVVDHSERREMALAMFEAARGEEDGD